MNEIRFVSQEPILKGWSGDRKYCVTDEHGTRFLLRVSPPEQREAKQAEFSLMQQVAALGVPMCRPLQFGMCAEGVYSLQSWIEGQDAESVIPALPAAEQVRFGLEAGRILKRIHTIPAPAGQEDWASRFNRKIDRKLKLYADCPVKVENGEAFIACVGANRHLLNGRPQVFQHGDYHIGNMMVDTGGQLVVIDFNRHDFGDPWEEFNRIVWCAQASGPFASGLVDGYFDGAVPLAFWRLLALYIASNTLSSVPWAIPFGQAEVDTMLKQARDVLAWYDNMRTPVPTSYLGTGIPARPCRKAVDGFNSIEDNKDMEPGERQETPDGDLPEKQGAGPD